MISTDMYSQRVDSTSFSINPRLSFYSGEKNTELLLHAHQGTIINVLVARKLKKGIPWR